jgi:RNA polymerase sigma factor (sigma-70 family)
MSPPPAEQLAPRLLLGTALRAQPDRRLVTLVREGYEAAFEEIDRRYRQSLNRFAASIVGGCSEDVTQDALSKALLALRGSDAEIELRPWLYRILRNTALNDLRDRPPPSEELGEAIPGARSAAAEAEGRQELRELMERLRALPEPQRAAIVMRELEGLSHEEIAAALGVSGGAARQAIYRARAALREGLGLLIPLPLVRAAIDHGGEAIGAGAGSAIAGGAVGAGGTAGALGGIGGGALKLGVATALIAGSVGAGVAIQHHGRGDEPAAASAQPPQGREGDRSAEIESGRDGLATATKGAEEGGHGGDAHRLDGSDDSGPSSSGGSDSNRHRGSGSSGEGSGDGIAGSGHDGRVDGGGDNSGRGGGGSGELESGSGSGGDDGESGPSGGGSDGSGGGGELSGDGGDGSGSDDLSGDGGSGGSTNSGPGGGETTSSSEPALQPAGP